MTEEDILHLREILAGTCGMRLKCTECPISSYKNEGITCWEPTKFYRYITNADVRTEKIIEYMINKYGIVAVQCEIVEVLL